MKTPFLTALPEKSISNSTSTGTRHGSLFFSRKWKLHNIEGIISMDGRSVLGQSSSLMGPWIKPSLPCFSLPIAQQTIPDLTHQPQHFKKSREILYIVGCQVFSYKNNKIFRFTLHIIIYKTFISIGTKANYFLINGKNTHKSLY